MKICAEPPLSLFQIFGRVSDAFTDTFSGTFLGA